MAKHALLTDTKALARRARQHGDEGVVTAGNDADREVVLRLLNEALVIEKDCVLRYRPHHYFMQN